MELIKSDLEEKWKQINSLVQEIEENIILELEKYLEKWDIKILETIDNNFTSIREKYWKIYKDILHDLWNIMNPINLYKILDRKEIQDSFFQSQLENILETIKELIDKKTKADLNFFISTFHKICKLNKLKWEINIEWYKCENENDNNNNTINLNINLWLQTFYKSCIISIFSNIITNAKEAWATIIKLEIKQNKNNLIISIEDNWIWIDKNIIENVLLKKWESTKINNPNSSNQWIWLFELFSKLLKKWCKITVVWIKEWKKIIAYYNESSLNNKNILPYETKEETTNQQNWSKFIFTRLNFKIK